MKTSIDQSLIARVVSGVRYVITGQTPTAWFGPGEPIAPIAQQVAGRQFDYPVTTNLQIAPRAGEPTTFAELRALADHCDIVRLAIETRKDQMARQTWMIQPRNTSLPIDNRSRDIATFFAYPDKTHDWHSWLRMLLEDVMVIDAPTLYVRLTQGNQPYAFDVIDGATIKRLLDEKGRIPEAPDPAYQQILKGLPAVNYSADELLYMPRNVRAHKIYGFSPVEQIVMTINTAIRKSLFQQQYYTEGSLPDSIIGVPSSWNPDQIGAFQRYWDEELSGNTGNRRRVKFVADGVNFHPTKTEPLKDEFDEWLARIVCYAFSLPPTPFIHQINRATAQTAQEAAESEGLAPLMQWVKALMDKILMQYFDAGDLEFIWQKEEETDPMIQAQINQIYVATGVKTVQEVRQELGLEDQGSIGTKIQRLSKAYHPDEPRDDRGRWTSGGDSTAQNDQENDHPDAIESAYPIEEALAFFSGGEALSLIRGLKTAWEGGSLAFDGMTSATESSKLSQAAKSIEEFLGGNGKIKVKNGNYVLMRGDKKVRFDFTPRNDNPHFHIEEEIPGTNNWRDVGNQHRFYFKE